MFTDGKRIQGYTRKKYLMVKVGLKTKLHFIPNQNTTVDCLVS